MTNTEWRVLERRDRWTMDNHYQEWIPAHVRLFAAAAEARRFLIGCRTDFPERVFKMQSRPKIQEWKDLRA